jgi:hypothetical protein
MVRERFKPIEQPAAKQAEPPPQVKQEQPQQRVEITYDPPIKPQRKRAFTSSGRAIEFNETTGVWEFVK